MAPWENDQDWRCVRPILTVLFKTLDKDCRPNMAVFELDPKLTHFGIGV